MHLNAVFEWVVVSWLEVILSKIVFTVFHNRASDILRGSKQWWALVSKISRGSGPSNSRRIDAYDKLHNIYSSLPVNIDHSDTQLILPGTNTL